MKKDLNSILLQIEEVKTQLAPFRFLFSHFKYQGMGPHDDADMQAIGEMIHHQLKNLETCYSKLERLKLEIESNSELFEKAVRDKGDR